MDGLVRTLGRNGEREGMGECCPGQRTDPPHRARRITAWLWCHTRVQQLEFGGRVAVWVVGKLLQAWKAPLLDVACEHFVSGVPSTVMGQAQLGNGESGTWRLAGSWGIYSYEMGKVEHGRKDCAASGRRGRLKWTGTGCCCV